MGSENREQNGISLHGTEPANSAVGSDGSFLFAAYTRKNVLLAYSTSPLPRFLASQDTGHHQTWRAYAQLSLRVLAAKFEGRRWSLEVSLVGS